MWVLVVVASVLLLASALTIWAKREVLTPSNWANTSAQLLENDEIRGQLSQYLVNQLYANVNVAGRLEQRLPPQADALAAPLAAGLEQAAVRVADELLQRPRVQALWKEANRRAVRDLIDILDGKRVRGISSESGAVILDLRPEVQSVASRLGVASSLPPDAGKLVILRADQIKSAQNGLKALRVLTVFLAIIVLVLYAVAIYLARGHRREVLRNIGCGLLIVGLLILVVRRIVGHYLVDSLVANAEVRPAASDAWQIATGLLRDVGIALVVYGILLALAACLAGPTRAAVAVRRFLAPAFRQHPAVVFGAVILVLILVVLWGPSAGGRALWGTLLLFALVLVGVEILRRQILREFPESPAAASPSPG